MSNTLDQECIMYRNITCACSACFHSNYIDCATNSTWTPKSREVVGQQALGNREVKKQRFDQAAISREERLQSRVAISDWNEHWETRGENRNELSLQRGDRSERRNAAKESDVPPPKRTRQKPRNE